MNYHRIYIALRTRWENDPTDRRALDMARKAKRLWKKSLKVERPPKVVDRRSLQARYAPLQAIVARGGRLLALDAEWNRNRPLTEVGLAVYEAGAFSYRNIRILPDFHPKNRFAYGETEFMTLDQCRAALVEEFAAAELFIGHAIDNDHKQFSRAGMPEIPSNRFDTLRFGQIAYPQSRNGLEAMVDRAGILGSRPHSGGNDAAMTLHLALAIAGYGDMSGVVFSAAEEGFYQHLDT